MRPRYSAFTALARPIVAATSLLTIAICSLHFTAMGAAIITPDPTIIVYPSLMDNATMALAVAGVTLLVMLAGLAAALIEKQTVQESVVRLHELADAPPRELSSPRMATIINVNQRISELLDGRRERCSAKRCSAICSSQAGRRADG